MAIPASIPAPALQVPVARTAQTVPTTSAPSAITPQAIPVIPVPGA